MTSLTGNVTSNKEFSFLIVLWAFQIYEENLWNEDEIYEHIGNNYTY